MMIASLVLGALIAAPELVVVTDTIPRGAPIHLDNVELVDPASKKLPRMLKPYEWTGRERLRAKRSLRPGTIVSAFDVEPMPDVAAGDPVIVELSRGRILVTASAVAKEDGFRGETIWVQNPTSQQRIRVLVVEAGRVRLATWRSR